MRYSSLTKLSYCISPIWYLGGDPHSRVWVPPRYQAGKVMLSYYTLRRSKSKTTRDMIWWSKSEHEDGKHSQTQHVCQTKTRWMFVLTIFVLVLVIFCFRSQFLRFGSERASHSRQKNDMEFNTLRRSLPSCKPFSKDTRQIYRPDLIRMSHASLMILCG